MKQLIGLRVYWVHRLVFFSAICTLPAALYMLPLERAAARLSTLSSERFYTEPDGVDLPAAMSLTAQYDIMIACDAALGAPIADVIPKRRREDVWHRCLRRADAMLVKSPNFSAAHLVRARATFQLDGTANVTPDLHRSQTLAPGLIWMALRRLETAVQHGQTSGKFANSLLDQEIALLLTTERGSRGVVAIYAGASVAAKDAMIQSIETLPANLQDEFLEALAASDRAQ